MTTLARGAPLAAIALLALAACARTAPPATVPATAAGEVVDVEPETTAVAVLVIPMEQRATPRGAVPYRGALPPEDPPLRVHPDQRPLAPAIEAALDVLYERPSPEGPPAIPLPVPRAIYAVGQGPIIRALPGPLPFIEHVPEILRTALPEHGPYSNRIVRLQQGDIRLVAFDYTQNDTKLSRDSMAVDIAFTDEHGDRWRIVQASLAPLSMDPVSEPWFGGLVIDTLYHGESGQGISAVPLVTCAMCSWGWADVWRNDQRVASSVLLHVMLTSDTRAGPERNFEYMCYDCSANPVQELHVIIPPSANLPVPGGFMHVMWENAEIRAGTPAQVAAAAPTIGEVLPTITLRAVPYLQWSDTTIHVQAGRRYRLVLQNDDPASAHAIHIHLSHEHGGGAAQHATRGRGEFTRRRDADPLDLPSAEGEIGVHLPHGPKWATTIEFAEPGTYEFYCPVENHATRGMRGRFIVTAPGQGGDQ